MDSKCIVANFDNYMMNPPPHSPNVKLSHPHAGGNHDQMFDYLRSAPRKMNFVKRFGAGK